MTIIRLTADLKEFTPADAAELKQGFIDAGHQVICYEDFGNVVDSKAKVLIETSASYKKTYDILARNLRKPCTIEIEGG